METIELWPLSQGEIDGAPDGFIDAAFSSGPEIQHTTAEDRQGYLDRVVRGGFPEAVARESQRRSRFLDGYVSDLINRDVIQLSEIERGPQMRTLVKMLAARNAQTLVPGTLARELGLSYPTVEHYLSLLEQVFLIKRIPAYSRNLTTRATSTAKVIMVDSGIATDQIGHGAASLRRVQAPTGALLEGFVISEIARQLSWAETRADLFHYRTKDKVEVDLLLENRRGQVVAVEVKASSTVRAEDFAGLRHLATRLGDDLVVGIVLYTGQQTLPFGPKFRAVPIAALWELAAP
jgi:predicted AAA+ superfamily ATPase